MTTLMDRNVQAVIDRLQQRAETGLQTYGVTTERQDLSLLDWLTHLQDELLDAAVYVQRLKTEKAFSTQNTQNPGLRDSQV